MPSRSRLPGLFVGNFIFFPISFFLAKNKKRIHEQLVRGLLRSLFEIQDCLWHFVLLECSSSPGRHRAATARLRSARPPASAARHNAARCVCWVRCGIPLLPELSGEGPQVPRLSAPHARAAAGRHRGGEERAAERSRRRAAAPPYDAVRVPLRCMPCSRARQRHVRCPLRGSPHLVRRQGRRGGPDLAAVLRGVRLGHGAL